MNKFEKLIEYIINDEDSKARELFHNIVVEKSRDIYESIMTQEEEYDPVQGAGNVETMHHELENEETMAEEDEPEEEEFKLDDQDDEHLTGEFPADGAPDGEPEDNEEEEKIEDKVMSIDAKLDELLSKFDEIMNDGHDQDMPSDEHSTDMPAPVEPGAEHSEEMFEADDKEYDCEDCKDEESKEN
jgi:hypothetical protein